MNKFIYTLCAFILISVNSMAQKSAQPKTDHLVFTPSEYDWKVGPEAFPYGAKYTVLKGNMEKEGELILQLWFPEGYKIPSHYHNGSEEIVVLSGFYNLGFGEDYDINKCNKMPEGSTAIIPSEKTALFGWSSEETVLQLHLDGPFHINYINPNDDPRNDAESVRRK